MMASGGLISPLQDAGAVVDDGEGPELPDGTEGSSTAAEATEWVRPEVEFPIVDRDILERIRRAASRKAEEQQHLTKHWDEQVPLEYLDLVPEIDVRRATIFLLSAPEATLLQQVRELGRTPTMPEWVLQVQAKRRLEDAKKATVRKAGEHVYIELPLELRDAIWALDKELRLLNLKYDAYYQELRSRYNVEELGLGLRESFDGTNGRVYFLTLKEAQDKAEAATKGESFAWPKDIKERMNTPRKNPKGAKARATKG